MKFLGCFGAGNVLSYFRCCSSFLKSLLALRANDPIDYIDPFIGTGNQGKDFPGASTPFGMTKVSPDTITAGVISYSYFSKSVAGFSFTHIGGADGGELANALTMATTGPLHTFWSKKGKAGTSYESSFSKKTESASAGYYAVTLDDYNIRAEATAAPHSGMLRFTFPQNDQSRIQIDLSHRHDGTSTHQTVKVTNDHTIEGTIDCPAAGGGWRFGPTSYTVYTTSNLANPSPRLACGARRCRRSGATTNITTARARTSAIPISSPPARTPRSCRIAARRTGSISALQRISDQGGRGGDGEGWHLLRQHRGVPAPTSRRKFPIGISIVFTSRRGTRG